MDSILTLNLTVHPLDTLILSDTILVENGYTQNGFNIPVQFVTGQLTDTLHLQSQYHCDSTVILNLEIICENKEMPQVDEDICEGEFYFFKGVNQISTGIYRDTLQTIYGCDSILTLNLTVHQPDVTPLYDTIWVGDSYTENGFTIPVQYIAGTKLDTLFLKNVFGCDSLVLLTLKIACEMDETILNETICQNDSYFFKNEYLSESGTYRDTLLSFSKCDSIVTLFLTVKPPYENTLTDRVPVNEIYSANGFSIQPVSAVGTFTYENNEVDVFGCDSVTTLLLTVYAEIKPDEFFTPNGDGVNDVWKIKNIEFFDVATVDIYDRFGKLLIHHTNSFEPWDGTYLGSLMPSTDYWYVITLKMVEKIYTGHFTLLRR